MSNLPDPHSAMLSLEEVLPLAVLPIKPGLVDESLNVMMDLANKKPRLTVVRIEAGRVTAFVNAIESDPLFGIPCFNIGCAVPVGLRGQGKATAIVAAAIEEMKAVYKNNGLKQFYVEAIVSVDNKPSIRVAEKVISSIQRTCEDDFNGGQVHQFLRLVKT